MIREYMEENVYEAVQNRLQYIFQEFDNIYLSFSGGKDSGLLLNLVLDFQQKYYPEKIIGVFHQDLRHSILSPQNILKEPLNELKIR